MDASILKMAGVALIALGIAGCVSAKGKSGGTLVALGDSYVANMRESPDETWYARYAASRGLVYRQYGINGNGLAVQGKNGTRMSERYKEMIPDADYVIVVGGHNDAALIRKGFGTREQFRREMVILIDGLRAKYPEAKICFITPWKVDEPCFPEMLDDFRSVCRAKGMPFYDAAEQSGIDPEDPAVRLKYFQGPEDRAHLNKAGHAYMLEHVSGVVDETFGL